MTTLPLVCLLIISQADATGAQPRSLERQATPAQLLADELVLPAAAEIRGKTVSLQDALAASNDRAAREDIVHAYWSLSAAIVTYHLRHDEEVQLDQLEQSLPAERAVGAVEPGAPPQADLGAAALASRRAVEAALAAARAATYEARLEVTAAQQTLATRMGRDPTYTMLPGDVPHTGGYNTQSQTLQKARTATPRVQLLHRSLPLRRQGLESRCDAVYAALDAMHAALDALDRHETTPEYVLARVARLREQRQAFIASVREYNADVATYALATSTATTPAQLVPMLIKVKTAPTPESLLNEERQPPRLPANTAQPVRSDRSALVTPSRAPEGGWTAADTQVLTAGGTGAPGAPSSVAPASSTAPTTAPMEIPSQRPAEPRLFRYKPQIEANDSRQPASKQPAANQGAATGSAWDRGLGDLWQQRTGDRQTLLGVRLHPATPLEQQTAAIPASEAVTLDQCLKSVGAANRKSVVRAYAAACEAAATYAATSDAALRLQELVPLALGFRRRTGGVLEMLDLQAILLDTLADRYDAQLSLLAAQHALTVVAGNPFGNWLWPASAPPADIDASQRADSSLTALSPYQQLLHARAEAVLRCDAASQQTYLDYRNERGQIAAILDCELEQRFQTEAFLKSQTRFHIAACEPVPAADSIRPNPADRSTRGPSPGRSLPTR